MLPVTYDDIQNFIPECDLVFESLKEDFDINKNMYNRVNVIKLSPWTYLNRIVSNLPIFEHISTKKAAEAAILDF